LTQFFGAENGCGDGQELRPESGGNFLCDVVVRWGKDVCRYNVVFGRFELRISRWNRWMDERLTSTEVHRLLKLVFREFLANVCGTLDDCVFDIRTQY
jgi:hypothetical protein